MDLQSSWSIAFLGYMYFRIFGWLPNPFLQAQLPQTWNTAALGVVWSAGQQLSLSEQVGLSAMGALSMPLMIHFTNAFQSYLEKGWSSGFSAFHFVSDSGARTLWCDNVLQSYLFPKSTNQVATYGDLNLPATWDLAARDDYPPDAATCQCLVSSSAPWSFEWSRWWDWMSWMMTYQLATSSYIYVTYDVIHNVLQVALLLIVYPHIYTLSSNILSRSWIVQDSISYYGFRRHGEINRLELPGARIILTMPLITRVNNVSGIPDLYLFVDVDAIFARSSTEMGVEEWHSEFQHGKQLGWSGSNLRKKEESMGRYTETMRSLSVMMQGGRNKRWWRWWPWRWWRWHVVMN